MMDPGSLKIVFAWVLPASLQFLVVFFINGCDGRWKTYQEQYYEISAAKNHSIKIVSQVKERVIRNADLGITDKCVTCHLGVTDTLMIGEKVPFKKHSGKYLELHLPETYGCTVCHHGKGDSLREEIAHGNGTRDAVLKGDLIEPSCFACHREKILEGSPVVSRGKQLLLDKNCVGCHLIDGLSPIRRTGPTLGSVGSKVGRKWLLKWLKNPKDCLPNATMPRFELLDEHADALAAYLTTFKDADIESAKEVSVGDSKEGGNLARLVRCISCHPFNGTGGHLAPDLGKIGNKVNKKWLAEMLKDPRRFQPESTMPQFSLSDSDVKNLVAWLVEEYTDYEIAETEVQDSTEEKSDSVTIDIGRRIYKELRCSNCHDLRGNDDWLELGPVLTKTGDKKVGEIDFGNSTIPRTLPDYIFEKIRRPKAFATKTNLMKMPSFDLSDEDAKDITLALLSFASTKIDTGKYAVAQKETTLFEPQGEAGKLVEKYQCFSCHAIKGRGYNLAYDLSLEGSRLTRDWLYDYLMLSYSIRPILVERMPVFRFKSAEAKVLTEYIMGKLVSNDLNNSVVNGATPEMIARGKTLFDEKGCMACHIVGEKGGYVGPSFTIGIPIGNKLQAGWVFAWLKNPQAIKPDVLEPNYGFSDENAKALTAYLMSLKKR